MWPYAFSSCEVNTQRNTLITPRTMWQYYQKVQDLLSTAFKQRRNLRKPKQLKKLHKENEIKLLKWFERPSCLDQVKID